VSKMLQAVGYQTAIFGPSSTLSAASALMIKELQRGTRPLALHFLHPLFLTLAAAWAGSQPLRLGLPDGHDP
jgi:hypothetical protein